MSMGSGGVFGNIPYGGGVPDGVWQQKLGLPAILGGGQTPPLPAVTQPIDQGKMKTWQKIVGAIGDGLQVAGGGKASFMPAILDMQARTDEERKWQAQLANQLQIAQAKLDKPPNPTQLQSNYEYAKTQDPSLSFGKFMQLYHPQMFGGFDGQYQMQQPEAPDGMTPMTSEELKAMGLNPGGPTANQSGGFR